MKWIIYILKCKDQSLYTGITNNLDRRIEQHISGNGSKYLRGRLPLKLVYKEHALNRSDATKRELEIKKLNKRAKQFLINSYKKIVFLLRKVHCFSTLFFWRSKYAGGIQGAQLRPHKVSAHLVRSTPPESPQTCPEMMKK